VLTVEELQTCSTCKAAITGFGEANKCPFCNNDNKAWKTKHVIKETEKVGTESIQVADYYVTPPPRKQKEEEKEEVKEEKEEEKGKKILGNF
jgi:hypothetical protein